MLEKIELSEFADHPKIHLNSLMVVRTRAGRSDCTSVHFEVDHTVYPTQCGLNSGRLISCLMWKHEFSRKELSLNAVSNFLPANPSI